MSGGKVSDLEGDFDLSAIRLLALDVDGTLLTSDHRLQPEVIAAVAEARAGGLVLMLATARSPMALKMIMQDLDHAGLVHASPARGAARSTRWRPRRELIPGPPFPSRWPW